jgi:hypothetical protein
VFQHVYARVCVVLWVHQKRGATSAPHDPEPPKSLEDFSPVQLARLSYVPRVPEVLGTTLTLVPHVERSTAASAADAEALHAHLPRLFGAPLVEFAKEGGAGAAGAGSGSGPVTGVSGHLRVGIVFCGRQTPGAHNVVWGLYDALKRLGADNEVVGAWASCGGELLWSSCGCVCVTTVESLCMCGWGGGRQGVGVCVSCVCLVCVWLGGEGVGALVGRSVRCPSNLVCWVTARHPGGQLGPVCEEACHYH